jgi:hypothetical protein
VADQKEACPRKREIEMIMWFLEFFSQQKSGKELKHNLNIT